MNPLMFILLLVIVQLSKADSYESAACGDIKKICEAAGFVVGEVNIHNGVWANCYTPLKNGHHVRNISLTEEIKQALKKCSNYEN